MLLFLAAGPGRPIVAFAQSGAGVDSARAAAPDSSATATAATDSLAPSTAVPWNPPAVVGPDEPWEYAVRLPLRIVTFPLSLLGMGLDGTLHYVEEHSIVPRAIILLGAVPKIGVGLAPARLGDRTGTGLAFLGRPTVLHEVVGFDIELSTHKYSHVGFDVAYGPGKLEYTYDWRPEDRFFGYGTAASQDEPSTYALRAQVIRLELAYPWIQKGKPLPKNQVRAWVGPREQIMREGREAPSVEEQFPLTAPLLNVNQEQMRYGIGVIFDHRKGAPHWTHGGRIALSAENFDETTSKTFAFKGPTPDAPGFSRLTGEASGGFSFRRDPHTLRLAIRAVDQHARSNPGNVLISDLMVLGGSQGLAGYEPGRFHDVDLVVAKLSYLFPLARYIEFDLHAETGGVYPYLKDATIHSLLTSYGIAIRPRNDFIVVGSFGLEWSRETIRFRYNLGGVE